MIPIIDDFKQRFGLDDFVVVADSGFMISRNIELLRSGGYSFIIGGRIKKYGADETKWILSLPHEDGLFHERALPNGDRLIVTVTNTMLAPEDVVAQYRGLWVVEQAFRVSKGTIETRHVFHFTERRIEAHVCLRLVAFKVYKELERLVAMLGLGMSVDTVLKIARTITTIRLRLPLNGRIITRTMMLTPQQRSLQPLFDHLGM